VQRHPILAPVVRPLRGLAVDRHHVAGEFPVPQGVDPGGEAHLEQIGIQGVEHVAEGIVRGNAPIVRQEPAQEGQPLHAPEPDLDEILHARQDRAQGQQQDLRQRIDHPPALARIRQRGKMVE